MTPFARKSLAACSGLLLIAGSSALLPGAALAADAGDAVISVVDVPEVVPSAGPASSAESTATAEGIVEPSTEPTAAPTPEPVVEPFAAPSPTPTVEPAPAPAPTEDPAPVAPQADPVLEEIPITVRSPNLAGWNGPIVAPRRFEISGNAVSNAVVTISDANGVVLATVQASASALGDWRTSVSYPEDAYTNQTIVITASAPGWADGRFEQSFKLYPPEIADASITTPVPGSTFRGTGTLVNVPFTGTGLPGAQVTVYAYPFAGIRRADLDGDQESTILKSTTVAADGTWAVDFDLPAKGYSFSAAQSLPEPEGSPYYPYRGISNGLEFRDIFVVSSAAGTLPETGANDQVLSATAMSLMALGLVGMIVASARGRRKTA
ncbi:hypothetical protein [Okibacterium fritillariae]|uniref:hypothetical protein n=1 Tax=Okibacterium fritillariae TaxID=123320 RepID=UPI00117FF7E3|nr:hypothetical protein [Okibacterium fritillariae]